MALSLRCNFFSTGLKMLLDDQKLAVDEAERIAGHEALKHDARETVRAEVAHGDKLDDRDRREAAAAGEQLKHKAIQEVADTEAEIERARGVARISQIVDYLFYLIYGFIGLEIILDLLGARESNAFNRFIERVSSPLLAPFRGLLADLTKDHYQLRLSYIFALVVYILVHVAINGFLRLFAHRKTAV
ncbi:MAG TPA: YggT family protein [Blastocatellia bacterium]|nr:YggT family protein [Blastocatellia bacterium]